MTWADFYLICFAVGFFFSFLSFVFGGRRIGHLHSPVFHGQAGGSHVSVGHGSAAHAQVSNAAPGQVRAVVATPASDGSMGHPVSVHVSPLNLMTLTAFLAWFGGTGYLLTRYSGWRVGFGLIASMVSGLIGGSIIFLFLSKVLVSHDENMDPADYEMVGVLGRVSSPVRAGGTGEMVYSQAGTRRVCGARGEDGNAIARGTEVVVTRYEKGIAYVRLWSELSGEGQENGGKDTASPAS